MTVLLDFASPMLVSLLLAAAAGPVPPDESASVTRVQLAQVTIEQRVIIRIPTVSQTHRRAALNAPAPPLSPDAPALKEVKGPKCLKVERLRGAVINMAKGVTMVTDGDERFRAHFGRSCRAADFYAGFYVEPNKDGSICAGRDALHARNGSACDIEKFSKLVPEE